VCSSDLGLAEACKSVAHRWGAEVATLVQACEHSPGGLDRDAFTERAST